jgi:hypothetical protein
LPRKCDEDKNIQKLEDGIVQMMSLMEVEKVPKKQ